LDLPRVLGNDNAVPADLTSVMMKRVIWLIFLSLTFVFIVTAVAGPVVTVIACAGLGLFTLPEARGVLSLFFVFVVTAAAGPVLAVVGCIAVLIYALAEARGDAVRRAEAEAAEAEGAAAEAKAAAAEAVIAEAEAVIAAARLGLLGGAAS
jgi:nucleoid-associated protein YgaU